MTPRRAATHSKHRVGFTHRAIYIRYHTQRRPVSPLRHRKETDMNPANQPRNNPIRTRRLTTLVIVTLAAFVGMPHAAALGAQRSDPDLRPQVSADSPRTVSSTDAWVPPGTPGPFLIRNPKFNLCLDSNASGLMYYGRCNSSDPGQRWGWWNGGWLISLQNGDCVSPWSAWGRPYLSLDSCNSELGGGLQHWTHRNQAIVNTYHDDCIEVQSEGWTVTTRKCRTSTFQTWTVTYL